MVPPDDAPTDRRKSHGPNHGRRWDDDSHQRDMFEWAQKDLGDRLFALRDDLGWSQERVARAARMKAETIADLENARGDAKFSTICRLMAVYGRYTRVLPEPRANVASRSRGAKTASSASV